MIRVFCGVPETYGNSYWAFMGHTGKERKASRVAAPLPHGLVRIGLGKGVGDRSRILKFPYAHQDPSMEYTSNEGKGVHLHTLVDRERKRSNERG